MILDCLYWDRQFRYRLFKNIWNLNKRGGGVVPQNLCGGGGALEKNSTINKQVDIFLALKSSEKQRTWEFYPAKTNRVKDNLNNVSEYLWIWCHLNIISVVLETTFSYFNFLSVISKFSFLGIGLKTKMRKSRKSPSFESTKFKYMWICFLITILTFWVLKLN